MLLGGGRLGAQRLEGRGQVLGALCEAAQLGFAQPALLAHGFAALPGKLLEVSARGLGLLAGFFAQRGDLGVRPAQGFRQALCAVAQVEGLFFLSLEQRALDLPARLGDLTDALREVLELAAGLGANLAGFAAQAGERAGQPLPGSEQCLGLFALRAGGALLFVLQAAV